MENKFILTVQWDGSGVGLSYLNWILRDCISRELKKKKYGLKDNSVYVHLSRIDDVSLKCMQLSDTIKNEILNEVVDIVDGRMEIR